MEGIEYRQQSMKETAVRSLDSVHREANAAAGPRDATFRSCGETALEGIVPFSKAQATLSAQSGRRFLIFC